ncbi:MAG: leucyl aminopeptidase [Dehalococcoidia bacterium]|nr:leucyl aminopeptidase [Dehalococcoidia bacterium]
MKAGGKDLGIKVIAGEIAQIEADAIVVKLFEGEQPGDVTAAVDKALGGAIARLIGNGGIKGKFGEVSIIHTLGKLPSDIVSVVVLGKRQDFTLDKVRKAAGESCRSLRKLNCHKIATALHDADIGDIDPEALAEAVVEGSLLGLYNFANYKKPEYEDIKETLIVGRDKDKLPSLEQGVRRGNVIAEATNLARDMINEPANHMTPSRMAEVAKEIAAKGKLEVNVFDSNEIKTMGMEAFLGVSSGSEQLPKLITLSYKGDENSKNTIGFVGKGITFDSGGISIKPSKDMDEMKGDMAGGAAVMAALSAIAQLKPKTNVVGIIPTAENMPSGSALKPGDVVKAMNGKTIEVKDTDCEGRLILADALSYAVKQGLSPVIDLATLTDSCGVALGTGYSGAFSNNQELMNRVFKAADGAGEKLWQLPLLEEYKEQIKSEIADIKNTGEGYGGAITAALILSEFVGNTPWVHLDAVYTSLSSKESGYLVKGATGVGVRTLVELALALANKVS